MPSDVLRLKPYNGIYTTPEFYLSINTEPPVLRVSVLSSTLTLFETSSLTSRQQYGLVARIFRSHRNGRGSIPRNGILFVCLWFVIMRGISSRVRREVFLYENGLNLLELDS